jgi:hypothetical protein
MMKNWFVPVWRKAKTGMTNGSAAVTDSFAN